MKIWLLTSEFPPSYGGGISTYCLETARMFSGLGHEITIITQDEDISGVRETHENGYKIIRFNPNQYYTLSFLGPETNLSFAFAETVRNCISKYGAPDVIESQEYKGIAYYLLQYKWLLFPEFKNTKIVITLHAPSFLYLEYNKVSHYKFPYFWIGEMERWCIRAADMVISPSDYLVQELKSRMVLDDIPIHIIKNPFRVSWSLQKNKPSKGRFIFFGKLIPQKGVLEVIDHFKQLWKEGFDYTLSMIGGGNHLYHPEGVDMIDYIRKRFKQEIQTGKLKLMGSVNPNEINKHLDDALGVIVPSIVDNLPYTVIEAMSRGKVVLASVQGGQSEIIRNGENGFLFDHHVTDSFKNQLTRIAALGDNELESISQKAYEEIKHTYSYETIFKQKESLLRAVIEKKDTAYVFPFTRPVKPSFSEHLLISDQKEPLLSVVIPYYNMGSYIAETMEGLFQSTYKNMEIIIVNDGSTEAQSIDALKDFENHPLVKVIHKKNEGLALARNFGALEAKGFYLAFIDPDDTTESDYYRKAIRILESYKNVYFVGCWAKYFGKAKGYWPAFNPEPPYLLVHNMINSSALVYKKQAFLNSGLNDPIMIYGMEDYESVVHMVKNGYHGVVLPEPLWNYRIRKDSMARAFTREKQIYLYRLISEKHSSFYATFASQITNLLNANGPGINYDNPTLTYTSYNKWMNIKFKQFVIKTAQSNPKIRKLIIQMIKLYNRR